MNVEVVNIGKKVSGVVVKGLYTEEETDKIFEEMDFLEPKLGDESKTKAAIDPSPYGEKRKKRGRGVFLDEVYTDRRFSTILTTSRKLFHDMEIKAAVGEIINTRQDSLYWQNWNRINHDSTLLQCYANGDYYDYHADHSLFTAITTFRFLDSWVGGNFLIQSPDGEVFNLEHKLPQTNQTIIFPSILNHRVGEVAYKNYDKPKSTSEYRWSVAHLISVR